MTTLADIRGSGGSIRLKPDGGIGFTGDDHFIPEIRAHKAEIIQTLQAEQLLGVQYRDSALYAIIDRHYCAWHVQCDSEERTKALSLLNEWDDALFINMKAGADRLISEWPVMLQLTANVPLAGKALAAAVNEMFPAAQPAPVNSAQSEAHRERLNEIISLIERSGLTVAWVERHGVDAAIAEANRRIALKDQPKQEAMPFFEPLPPKTREPGPGPEIIVDLAAFGAAVASSVSVEAFG